jgi:hypothetical protein
MFTSRNKKEESSVLMGGLVAPGTELAVESPGKRTLIRLFRDGRVVSGSTSGRLTHVAAVQGAYRIEVYQFSFRMGPFFFGTRPWIFSNPIYVS